MARKIIKKNSKTPAKMAKEQPTGVKLEVPRKEDLLGKYANMAVINHTEREFVIDFMTVLPGMTVLTSRIITNPQHIKEVRNALDQNIKRYEEKYGKIKTK